MIPSTRSGIERNRNQQRRTLCFAPLCVLLDGERQTAWLRSTLCLLSSSSFRACSYLLSSMISRMIHLVVDVRCFYCRCSDAVSVRVWTVHHSCDLLDDVDVCRIACDSNGRQSPCDGVGRHLSQGSSSLLGVSLFDELGRADESDEQRRVSGRLSAFC